MHDYNEFFRYATGFFPYHYQCSLAVSKWPDMLGVPTGLGKTAAVIIAWIYKRLIFDSETPRRLVYCLPMRGLVEQTYNVTEKWIDNLFENRLIKSKPAVHVLMGGEYSKSWDRHPQAEAIIIGTQDQLLSRALNRGYAMSRFRWPVHFGLLNNDCFWIMDEVQLMGTGLETTVQMQAFRERFGTVFPTRSMWCSATINRDWMSTVDYKSKLKNLTILELSADDTAEVSVSKRVEARKQITKAPAASSTPSEIAKFALSVHRPGTRTIVIVNTVLRAQQIYHEIVKREKVATVVLVHSRYRPLDRKRQMERVLEPPTEAGIISVCTQVLEAGVDVSSTTLITELAPWPSLIQRFGRLNRDGGEPDARAYWIDLDLSKKDQCAPYEFAEIAEARDLLAQINDVGLASLPKVTQPMPVRQVLRSVDLLDLFDTTNDLAGADIDVSRFIRDSSTADVQVFWRSFPDSGPETSQPEPARDELCNVSIGGIVAWLKTNKAWRWDSLDGRWAPLSGMQPIPGMVLMLRDVDGGYGALKGWTGDRKDIPEVLDIKAKAPESYVDQGVEGAWLTVAEHTDRVVLALEEILELLGGEIASWRYDLGLAARWHDAGKAHWVFQNALSSPPDTVSIWGKSPKDGAHYARPGFRHEMASALAVLASGGTDLVAYLVAAHHGKVRLSIRSLPVEKWPPSPATRFARGIWEGDVLPVVDLGHDVITEEITLDLSAMELGDGKLGPSWTSRMLALRDAPDIGPFRLAFLETLLRIADWKGSEENLDV